MKALSIHLTDICNSKCTFCIVDSPYFKKDTIDRKRVSRFLRLNKDKGYEAVNIHGGEATIRRDFFEILEEIRDLGYPTVFLQTNGRKLAKLDYAREVVAHGVSLFIVSLHGADAAVQDGISLIRGSYDQAIKGMRNIKLLGQKIRTNTVVCKQNYTTLPDIISRCIELDADHINISALHTAGTAFRNFWEVTPTYAEIRPYVFEAVDRAVAANRVLTLEGFPHCSIPGYEQYMINWQDQHFKLLIRELIWEDYEHYMDAFTRVKDEKCRGCAQNSICGGVYKEYAELIGWGEFQPFPPSVAVDSVEEVGV